MKTFAFFALSLLVATTVQSAQVQSKPPAGSAATAAPAPKINPAKEADIRRLLDVVGTAALVQQMMRNMEQNIKPVMTNSLPPGDYRAKLVDLFFEKFESNFSTKSLLDLAVVRYDENFSDAEIKQLIKFYETPLGQKVVTVLPKLTAEMQQDGQRLGQQVGRDSMKEVLAEHPDLAKAFQAAAQQNAPAQR